MQIIAGPGYTKTVENMYSAADVLPGLDSVMLCWSAPPPQEVDNYTVVRNAGGWVKKLDQYSKLRDAGIHVPLYTTSRTEALRLLRQAPNWRDVWGRKDGLSRGRGIWLPASPTSPGRRWMESEYWVVKEKYPYDEYRFHIFDGKSIIRSKKVKTGESWRRADVRNHGNGWTFVRDCPPQEKAREIAKKAVSVLGYTWGAVDLLVKRDGTVVVLEVNRFPGMDMRTAKAYVEAIERMVSHEE